MTKEQQDFLDRLDASIAQLEQQLQLNTSWAHDMIFAWPDYGLGVKIDNERADTASTLAGEINAVAVQYATKVEPRTTNDMRSFLNGKNERAVLVNRGDAIRASIASYRKSRAAIVDGLNQLNTEKTNMATILKWHRAAPGNLETKFAGLDLEIYQTQYGTFTSTRKFNWRVTKDGKLLRAGSTQSQQYAKRHVTEAVEQLAIQQRTKEA